MDVRDLRQRLASLEATLSTWGAKAGEIAELKRFTDALASFDNMSVAAFCKQLGGMTSDGTTTPRAEVRAKKKLDEGLVDQYVAAFGSEALDYATLQSTLADLSADTKAKVPELSAIASRLAGAERKYNKSKALEKIEAVVRRRLDTRRRMEGTSGVF
jgi:predicted DNA-binding transcriptional regulator YafY